MASTAVSGAAWAGRARAGGGPSGGGPAGRGGARGGAGGGAGVGEAVRVARCREGDRAAVRVVYERYRRRVYAMVMRIAGEQEAEELTQEVFLKAFRGVDKFRGEAQLGTWLYRMAVNAALSHVGRSKEKRRAPEEALMSVPAPEKMVDGDPRLREKL